MFCINGVGGGGVGGRGQKAPLGIPAAKFDWEGFFSEQEFFWIKLTSIGTVACRLEKFGSLQIL